MGPAIHVDGAAGTGDNSTDFAYNILGQLGTAALSMGTPANCGRDLAGLVVVGGRGGLDGI